MKKVLSIAAVALMVAGSSAFACGGCGCEAKKTDKKADKEKTECSACKGAEKQTACGGAKKADKASAEKSA